MKSRGRSCGCGLRVHVRHAGVVEEALDLGVEGVGVVLLVIAERGEDPLRVGVVGERGVEVVVLLGGALSDEVTGDDEGVRAAEGVEVVQGVAEVGQVALDVGDDVEGGDGGLCPSGRSRLGGGEAAEGDGGQGYAAGGEEGSAGGGVASGNVGEFSWPGE